MSIHVNPNKTVVLVAGLVLLGVCLRLYGLEHKIIWHDEVATRVLAAGAAMAAQMQGLYTGQVVAVSQVLQYQQVQHATSVLTLIGDLARHDPQHPPLYYLLAKVWVDLWGDSVYVLRMLSVLFSALSLLAMYWLLRELTASRRAAALALLLMCVSPLFILYAQEAREYAFWSLALLLSSAARLAALRMLPVGGCLYVTINRGFNTGSGFICRLRDAFAMDACLVRLYREPEHRWLIVLTLGAELTAKL